MRKMWMTAAIGLVVLGLGQRGYSYIEAAYSLGEIVHESTNIVLMRVESVDRDKNTIIFRKVEDIKGKHPLDLIKQNIAHAGFTPKEWQNVMAWAAEGKLAVMCHNGSASETCIDNYWYQCYPGKEGAASEWWNMYHGEPYLLRSYAGKPEKLAAAMKQILAGQEAIVPCMVDGDKNALALRIARIQRMRASLKLADYNPARDFAGWGGEEICPIVDMAGFAQMSLLPKLEEAEGAGGGGWGVAMGHMEDPDKTDMVVFNDQRFVILKNEGEGSFDPVEMPGASTQPSTQPATAPATQAATTQPAVHWGGARGAAWSDYNGTKRDSVLLATPTGPKLFTNMGSDVVRDDSQALPNWGYAGLTAVAWVKMEKPDRPAMLLADEFAGLRVLENKVSALHGKGELPEVKFKDVSDDVGLGSAGLGAGMKVADLIVADLLGNGGEEVIVNGADGRVLVLRFADGKFQELKGTGLAWGWRAHLAVGDVDGDGRPDVVAVEAGMTRVFRNLGGGKFENVTRKCGLAGVGGASVALVPRSDGNATVHDLLIGRLRESNQYFKNDGHGVFTESTGAIGLDRRIFNSRALAVLPVDKGTEGAGDLVMVNEGQPSAVLLWKK